MDGQPAQAREPQHQTARTARTARTAGKQGRRVGTRGTQQAALNGGLAVWQVGNARGGGK